ncbi:MAG: four-carbon acid sugar kinase family protein [Acidobacteria bacterium]|nr:MAG: four-carbon acid sugar kinase family protein [Acidobacteriota bacterium]
MQLGVIADDVTGATDLASVLRRDGFSVVQTLGVPQSVTPPADVVVVSLKTRTAPVDEATAAARAAAAYLTNAGATQIYFKYCSTFDSTDRGNIGPVIATLLEQLHATFTIACPAYPALARTVYQGYLFVGTQLLSESSMRDHPLTPMTDANLVRVLGRQSPFPVGLVALDDVDASGTAMQERFAALQRSGHRVAIVDAVFDRHVDAIGCACRGVSLVTGGAALGGALARAAITARIPVDPQHAPARSGPVVVLSGSGSAATLEQVRRLAADVPHRALDPLALARDGAILPALIDWAEQHVLRGPVLLYSTASPETVRNAQRELGRSEAAATLEHAFGGLAAALARQGVRTFVVAGGETSGAVLEALGIRMLGFGEEIDPGVPWTRSLDPEGFHLALKSGNFGSPDFFIKALQTRTA